jgi:hypothetical protein
MYLVLYICIILYYIIGIIFYLYYDLKKQHFITEITNIGDSTLIENLIN